MKCDICQDAKRVRLMRHHELECAPTPAEEMTMLDHVYREFDCPQCVPMVPYQKVRALKVVSDYDVEQARKFQEPIKRSLAAAFGEYLLRKGLISFTTDETDRMSNGEIKIIAEMGAVTVENAERAGAPVEKVETDAPPLSRKLTRQLAERAAIEPWAPGVPMLPEPAQFRRSKSTKEKAREIRESREGARARFSGLELYDEGEFQ